MTDHPLTEEVVAEMWDAHPYLDYYWSSWSSAARADLVSAFRAAHDIGREYERANPVDDRPWEPLNGGPVRVGDEVRQDWYGVTRGGIVGRVDGNGDPWTAEGGYIGPILGGTWYVRRAVRELPEEDGAVIVPAAMLGRLRRGGQGVDEVGHLVQDVAHVGPAQRGLADPDGGEDPQSATDEKYPGGK